MSNEGRTTGEQLRRTDRQAAGLLNHVVPSTELDANKVDMV